MGLGEAILVSIVCIMAIVGMIKNAKGSRGGSAAPPPTLQQQQMYEDIARMRQMKELDRFDKKDR